MTGAGTMQESSLGGKSAVKRTKILVAALACLLLGFGLMGCGSSNNLKSITLNVIAINGAPTSQSGGIVSLEGLGGTIQLQAMGNYTGSASKDLSKQVTFNVVVDPLSQVFLLPPCQPPLCPAPASPPYTNGTVEFSASGLVTAVEPAMCTWVNSDPNGTLPAWAYDGDYVATASYLGVTSEPVYMPVASAAGEVSTSNPSGACGPG